MKYLLSTILTLLLLTITACSSTSKSNTQEINFTSHGETKKIEVTNPSYQWGNTYLDCETFFDMSIREQPTAESYALVIKCPIPPNEIKEGDDITNSVIRYSRYPLGSDDVANSKQGSITVIKKTTDDMTLKFSNFKFTLDYSDDKYGLNGTVTFKYN